MPADPVKSINGKDCKLYRDGHPPVYLMPDGRFAAFYQARWLIRASLKQLDGSMKRMPKPIPVMLVDSSTRCYQTIGVKTIQVVQFYQSGKYLDELGKLRYGATGDKYIRDDAVIARLAALEEKRAAYSEEIAEEFHRIMKAARRIDRYNLRAVQEGETAPTEAERNRGRGDSE